MNMFRCVMPALILSGGLLSGCASIVHSGPRTVTIGSSPAGVPFVVKNKAGVDVASGITPSTQILSPKAGFFQGERYSVIYKPQGGADQIQPLESSMSAWYLGNIIFGGLIGLLIVDPATGAMWNLQPTVMANLPATPSSAAMPNAVGGVSSSH